MSIQIFNTITSFAVAVWESLISQAGRIYKWHFVHNSLAQCLMSEWSLCWRPYIVTLGIHKGADRIPCFWNLAPCWLVQRHQRLRGRPKHSPKRWYARRDASITDTFRCVYRQKKTIHLAGMRLMNFDIDCSF